MSASERCWQAADPWFEAIMAHPFVRGLEDGSLPEDVFTRYLIDDAHYLAEYARVLAQLAVRAESLDDLELFASSAAAAVGAERMLHTDWLTARDIDLAAGAGPGPTATCRAYTGTLLQAAVAAPYDVAVATVLPCFRVYAEVGHRLQEHSGSGHPYAAWIETYADPQFEASVRRVEACLDRVALDEDAVREAYVGATRLEWMFWDAAWRGEAWPTSAPCGDEQ